MTQLRGLGLGLQIRPAALATGGGAPAGFKLITLDGKFLALTDKRLMLESANA